MKRIKVRLFGNYNNREVVVSLDASCKNMSNDCLGDTLSKDLFDITMRGIPHGELISRYQAKKIIDSLDCGAGFYIKKIEIL